MAHIIADWTPLGKDTFYRKLELYVMEWDERINLSDFIIAAAQFGGPIALIKDDKKILKAQGASGKPPIHIFSASGRHLSSIKWTASRVVQLGWSSSEDLLIIQDDGTVHLYDIFGNFQRVFSMGQEVKDTKVMECKIFNNINVTGVAVLTTSFRIYLVNNINDAKIRRMPEIPASMDLPPSCWTILPEDRQNFQLPNSKVLVGKEADLYILDTLEQYAQQQFPEFSSPVNALVEVAVSCDTKYVTLVTSSGIIWIGSSDFQTRYCEFDTKCPSRPTQLLWCGSEAVIGHWDKSLLVIGLEKDYLNYVFDSPIFLVSEMDGVRIISNTTYEMLQKVPDVVRDIFRIGSMDPGAILLEASKEFVKKSHRADEYIHMIKEQLGKAVDQCIEAAGHEYQASIQKMLLRAASFGKCFLPEMDPEKFVKMCQILRVLNAVRDYTLGLPLTHAELECLSLPVLRDRLVLRRQYCLAIRICQYLKIPDSEGASRILAHWACYKVKQIHVDEEMVAVKIANKLGYSAGISYAEIANKAIECGRTQLAIKLLDYEPRASEQVPLLMKLAQPRQAMTKAIESGDTDLVYLVIMHLRDTLPVGEFQMVIRNFPTAHSLYMKYCKEQDPELVRRLYYQEDDFQGEGSCRVLESYKAERSDQRLALLQNALELYRKGRNEFATTQTEEHIKLLRYQLKLEEKFNVAYLDKSLHDTISQLLLEGEVRLAEELKKQFKVPDKRYWWVRIQVLAALGQWAELEKFSKSKKSPIGFEPFVDVCLKYDNKYESLKYLPKVQNENKVKYYVRAGQLEEAANIALEQKDDHGLKYVQDKCVGANAILAEKVQSMRSHLLGRH